MAIKIAIGISEHRGLLQQKKEVELFCARGDGSPAGEHGYWCEKAGEHNEPERDTVNAQVVVDIRALDPDEVLDELEAAGAVVIVKRQVQGKRKRQQGNEERAPLNDLALAGQQRNQQRAQRRDKDQNGKDVIVQHQVQSLSRVTRYRGAM
jgi:hypothetical protein